MNINSIGAAQKSYSPIPQNTTPITPENTTETPKEKTAKTPGVVRLLEEGHFKPTADVRLRLNFAEHLDTSAPLDPAEGVRGKAYDKFLSIYQDRFDPAESVESETDPVPPVDPDGEIPPLDTTNFVDVMA